MKYSSFLFLLITSSLLFNCHPTIISNVGSATDDRMLFFYTSDEDIYWVSTAIFETMK